MPQRISRQKGFTLIEVMAVLAIGGLLLGGMWEIYHNSMRAYQRGLQEVRLTQGARTMLRLMTRDIQKAFATAAPHGIQGTQHQGAPEADADRLELIMAVYPALGLSSSPTPGLGIPQSVRYRLEPAPANGPLVLKRAVVAAGSQATERSIPLGEGLHGLSLRYFDGQVWSHAWQRTTLPQALEITVVFRHSGGDTRTQRFTTVVTAD